MDTLQTQQQTCRSLCRMLHWLLLHAGVVRSSAAGRAEVARRALCVNRQSSTTSRRAGRQAGKQAGGHVREQDAAAAAEYEPAPHADSHDDRVTDQRQIGAPLAGSLKQALRLDWVVSALEVPAGQAAPRVTSRTSHVKYNN